MNEQLQKEDNELIDWEYQKKEEQKYDRNEDPNVDYARTEMSAIRETYFNKNEQS